MENFQLCLMNFCSSACFLAVRGPEPVVRVAQEDPSERESHQMLHGVLGGQATVLFCPAS
jgi:hypothetical protein